MVIRQSLGGDSGVKLIPGSSFFLTISGQLLDLSGYEPRVSHLRKECDDTYLHTLTRAVRKAQLLFFRLQGRVSSCSFRLCINRWIQWKDIV